MKKFPFQRAVLLIFVLMLLLSASFSSLADFGDISGDTDWGGSDWGGGDFDFGGSDWGSSGSFVNIGGLGEPIGGFTVLIIIVVIVVILLLKKRAKGIHSTPSVNTNITQTPVSYPIAELKASDPNFSADALKEKISNLYIQMQNCWQAKDLTPLQNSMTDAFYNQSNRQIQNYIKNHQTNKIERIAVLSVDLKGYNMDDTNTTIVANINTRLVDYVVDDATGKVIRGSATAEKFMTYEWCMIRSRGVLTGSSDGTTSIHCSSCGAPMNVNFSAKCEYCGTVMQTSEYDWVLSAVKGLSQKTL